jgi:hypothetical protein
MARPRARKEVRMTPGATKRAQGLPLHLHDRMPTEENATKAEVVEVGAMDTIIGSAIGGLVHLEVETAGVAEGGVEKGIEITLLF